MLSKSFVQLIEEMRKEPTERQLMQEALDIAKNTSAPADQREAALKALRYLVEPIDNANGALPVGLVHHTVHWQTSVIP